MFHRDNAILVKTQAATPRTFLVYPHVNGLSSEALEERALLLNRIQLKIFILRFQL